MSADPDTPRAARSIARMRRILDRGRMRFIISWGVIGAGVPLYLMMSLLPSLGWVPWLAESTDKPVFNILTGAVLWPVAGYLLGLVVWRALEWRYDALMQRK